MNREVYISSAAEFVPMAVGIFAALAPRTVALSGGSTPAPIYRRLAALRYPWDSVDVFFGDERCVPPDDKDSNFRMANAALLSAVPARAHPMNGVRGDADGYANELTATFGAAMPRFDLVFLGLGEDGHTASLFPGSPALDERTRTVVKVQRPDHARLTLTLPVLNAARNSLFLVAGAGKRAALRDLLSDADIPAARVHSDRVIVLADEAAAASL